MRSNFKFARTEHWRGVKSNEADTGEKFSVRFLKIYVKVIVKVIVIVKISLCPFVS